MNTPIYDFVKNYAKQDPIRLHMPGHKGMGLLGIESLDITEIKGADSLYEADGIIAESEQNAAKLFGTKATFYSTEGSSHCIRVMLWMAKQYAEQKGKKAFIAAFRNTHKTFVTAAALLGIEVDYLYPNANANYLSCPVSADAVSDYFKRCPNLPTALYVTSPDYLGNLADISSLAAVCREHEVLLIVDNAHGAYLRFWQPSLHPMDQGADLCCDSAHKTLPVLTGGAYLHIAQNASNFFVENARNALSLFGSTSPSYLILQSLDLANRYLSQDYSAKLAQFVAKLDEMKEHLVAGGYRLWEQEPLKLTIDARAYGYRGDQIAEYLRQYRIETEFSDPDAVVMMFTPEMGERVLSLTENALLSLKKQEKLPQAFPICRPKERAMAALDAISAPFETVNAEDTLGRILACPTVGCPPAVPIVTCGERIDTQTIEAFAYYGIRHCRVVSKK